MYSLYYSFHTYSFISYYHLGRWRILKTGIRVHGIESADNIWFTCCALHNMLLNVDGLDKRWKKGVPSPFEGELGWHAVGDVETYAPLIFRRVRNNLANEDSVRTYDASKIPLEDYMYGPLLEDEEEEINKKTSFKILRLTNKIFRDKLVTNFHKRWENKDIVWPSRTGEMTA